VLLKIITHNVYWFQGFPSRWGEEKVDEFPDVLDALTQLYASAKVDVLCLQEVHRSDLAEKIACELNMTTNFHVPGGFRPDYGGVVMSRGKAKYRDCVEVDGTPRHERVHVHASIECDKGELELAMLHLPSNRFADSLDSADAARVAELECALTESPRPNLVVGDMNCLPGSTPYQFMLDSGYIDVAVATDDDSAQKRRRDYIWLDKKHATRLKAFSVLDGETFSRTSVQGEIWHLSDHPPLLMELQ